VIHVYGFVSEPPPKLGIEGLGGAVVETHALGPIATVLSRHANEQAATEESVLRHAQVVDAAMHTAGGVLPARFGTVYPDDAALGRAVAPRAHELCDRLARVRGCVELGVRALGPESEDESAGSGGEYMRVRLREACDRRRLAGEVHGALSELSRESTHRFPHSGRAVLAAAYLVPAESRGLFVRRVEELGRARGVTIVCTGPWPPYSFAEAA
jgi:Gas vesicle synthesis protein GvpL/GvpF